MVTPARSDHDASAERGNARPARRGGALGQQLADDPAAAGAERQAHAGVAVARDRARQHEVRDVGAGRRRARGRTRRRPVRGRGEARATAGSASRCGSTSRAGRALTCSHDARHERRRARLSACAAVTPRRSRAMTANSRGCSPAKRSCVISCACIVTGTQTSRRAVIQPDEVRCATPTITNDWLLRSSSRPRIAGSRVEGPRQASSLSTATGALGVGAPRGRGRARSRPPRRRSSCPRRTPRGACARSRTERVSRRRPTRRAPCASAVPGSHASERCGRRHPATASRSRGGCYGSRTAYGRST